MQMTEERQSLIIKIGLGIAAAIFVAIITIVVAHMLNPQTKSSIASTSSQTSTTTPTTPAATPAPAVGSTQSIDSLMSQDATSEDSINATYENNNVTSNQTTNQTAANVGSAYDESSF